MRGGEDDIPINPYAWSKGSEISLQDFLTKHKPSMVQNDGSKPWIWVKGSEPSKVDDDVEAATKEASNLLNEVSAKIENIKNDASIPTRSNKKTGAKSKKEMREQTQAEAAEKLKEISTRLGFVSGKWLIFAPADKVDTIWSKLATSLAAGPLASTPGYLAKVSTCPQDGNPHFQHLICVYLPDVYDKDAVTKVMKILLRNHGVNLSGVKSNLYTAIGLDSKHSSGISSTIWKNTALLSDSEIKKLKDAFYADLAGGKTATSDDKLAEKTKEDAGVVAVPSKQKLKLKNKADDDPFASDVEDKEEEETRKKELKSKNVKESKHKHSEDVDEERLQTKKRKT